MQRSVMAIPPTTMDGMRRGRRRMTWISSRGLKSRAMAEAMGARMAGRRAVPAFTKIGTTARVGVICINEVATWVLDLRAFGLLQITGLMLGINQRGMGP